MRPVASELMLIEAGLDFLSCSFDGYDKVSYEAARTGKPVKVKA